MRTHLAMTVVLGAAMLTGGCATKKYVRNTTAPIQAKVDQVGDQTTKNSASRPLTSEPKAASAPPRNGP
jgi:hypothetical protein